MRQQVVVSGGFDDIRSKQLRFLEEASKLGELTVLLWSDETLELQTGQRPRFPFSERYYVLSATRYVARVLPLGATASIHALPAIEGFAPHVWVDLEGEADAERAAFCHERGMEYLTLLDEQLAGFPQPPPEPSAAGQKKVVVTGCYDWFHSGHVRFFEEVSAHGDLYVIVGHDANIRLLKGAGHPLVGQEERRYVTGSIKFVKQALISSGDGWLDADPEIQRLQPDIYAVNDDGDRGGKREYCQARGLEYLVLKRAPAAGLPPRTSTDLRGF